jgi:hypothetical protein
MGLGGFCLGAKGLECESDHVYLSISWIKNEWSYVSLPYASMTLTRTNLYLVQDNISAVYWPISSADMSRNGK